MGAGSVGVAASAELSRQGYRVALYGRSLQTISPLAKIGGVEIEGNLGEDFIKLPLITNDLPLAIRDSELILLAIPASSHRDLITSVLPYLQPGHIILLTTGSAGSLELGRILRQAGFNLNDILLGECVVAPLSARMVSDVRVRIRLTASNGPKRLRTSAFPGRNTEHLIEKLGPMFHWIPKPNVLEVGLNNPNFLIHPAPVLLNYAAIERSEGHFSIMNEGMTEGVLRFLDAVDTEKMALQTALGLDVISIDDFYRETGVGPQTYREKGEPFSLHDRIWDRYITEDVPYGIVMFSSLGQMLGVPTPMCNSIIDILSVVKQINFRVEGRTVDRLGIAGLNQKQVLDYLETGERPE